MAFFSQAGTDGVSVRSHLTEVIHRLLLSKEPNALEQLENHFKRKAMAAQTLDTIITKLEGETFVPGDDIATWFDEVQRQPERCAESRCAAGVVRDLRMNEDELHGLT